MPGLVELRPVPPTPSRRRSRGCGRSSRRYTGVVRSLGETLAAPDEHRLISIGCELADAAPTIGEPLESYTGSEHWLRDAGRGGGDRRGARALLGLVRPAERLVVGSRGRARRRRRRSRRASRSSPTSQHASPAFPFRPFRRDTVVSWVEGFSLPGGERALLPAQLVYMPWRRRAGGEARIGHATSSGLACGATLEEAIAHRAARARRARRVHARLAQPAVAAAARLERRRGARPARPPLLRAVRAALLGRRPERLPRRADGARRRARAARAARGARRRRGERADRRGRVAEGARRGVLGSPLGARPRARAARSSSAGRPPRSRPSTGTRSSTPTVERARRAAFLDASRGAARRPPRSRRSRARTCSS